MNTIDVWLPDEMIELLLHSLLKEFFLLKRETETSSLVSQTIPDRLMQKATSWCENLNAIQDYFPWEHRY